MATKEQVERKNRLQKEGKWNDWVRLRDKLKEEGLTPKEAAEKATVEVDMPGFVPGKFGPAGTPQNKIDSEESDTTASKETWAGREPCTTLQAGIWAGENLRVYDARPEDAPCSLAWAWLCEMRDNTKVREGFFNAVLPRSFQSSKEKDKDDQRNDDGHRVIGLISEVYDAAQRSNAFLSDGPEGIVSEPEIPEGDDPPWEQEQ